MGNEQESTYAIFKKNIKELFFEVPKWLCWSTFFSILLIIFLFYFCIGCSSIWDHYPQDNIAEEAAEALIKEKTGIKIDLSPRTPEMNREYFALQNDLVWPFSILRLDS